MAEVMAMLRGELDAIKQNVFEGVRQGVGAVKKELEQYTREQCDLLKKEMKEEMEEVAEAVREVSRQLGRDGATSPPATLGAGPTGFPLTLPSPAVPLHAATSPAGAAPQPGTPPANAVSSPAPAGAASPHRSPKRRTPQEYEGRASWAAYQAQFEILASAQGWSEGEKAVQLVTSLKGPALDVLSQLAADQRTSYACVVDALERRYGHQHQEEVYRARFRGRMRARGESLQHLAQDLERLVRQAYPSAAEDLTTILARDQFVDALVDPQIKISVKQARAANLQEALAHALEFEALMLTSGMRPAGSVDPAGRQRQDHRARRARPAEGGEGAFRGKCWACGERGHRRGECTRRSPRRESTGRQRGRRRTRSLGSGRSSPRPLCCWSCGDEGHFSRACPNPGPVSSAARAGNVTELGRGATPQPPSSRPHSR